MPNKENLDIYLSAISNEYYIDATKFKRYFPNIYSCLVVTPLRSLKLITMFKDKIKLLKFFIYIGRIIWWPIIYPLLILIELLHSLVIKIGNYKLHVDYSKCPRIALIFSSGHKKAISNILSGKNLCFFSFKHYQHSDAFRIESMIPFNKYLEIFIYSLVLPLMIRKTLKEKEKNNPGFCFQLFDAFDCFLYIEWLNIVKKKVKNIYFCSHFDRWAIITSRICNALNLSLVQHGYLHEYIEVPYKVKNISNLYVFDKRSKKMFLKNIIENCPKVKFSPLSLKLKETKGNKFKRTILLICEPQSENKEILIINHIAEKFPLFFLYIKPHPSFPKKTYKIFSGKPNMKVIKEKTYYPKVDLAITSSSTLGLEYKSCGQKVFFFHELSNREILKKLDKLLLELEYIKSLS